MFGVDWLSVVTHEPWWKISTLYNPDADGGDECSASSEHGRGLILFMPELVPLFAYHGATLRFVDIHPLI